MTQTSKYAFSHSSPLYGLSQDTKSSSLCYTVSPGFLKGPTVLMASQCFLDRLQTSCLMGSPTSSWAVVLHPLHPPPVWASCHSLSGSRSWSFPLWCLLECPPDTAPTSHLSWRFPSVQSIILCGGRLSLISTLSQFHWLGSLSFIILIEIRIKQRSITMTILLRVFAQVKDCKVSVKPVHSDHHCKFRVWESYCVEWLESQSILVLSKNQWLSLWGSRTLYHFNYICLHRNWLYLHKQILTCHTMVDLFQ